jgi:hypothetical protein
MDSGVRGGVLAGKRDCLGLSAVRGEHPSGFAGREPTNYRKSLQFRKWGCGG